MKNHERWTDAFLDEMREVGDPPADDVIADLFARGDIGAVNQLLDRLTRNDGIPSTELPPVLRAYLASTALLPSFDPAAVAAAQALFARQGPSILVILGFYSLPASYMAKKGVQVLYRTGYIGKKPTRRVFETVQMVIDVLSPGGLALDGRGVRTAQKVRLLHAAIRRLLRHDPTRPWEAELGVPINQEDLAGTLMTFSCLVIEGLGRLGIAITDDEREGYIHLWAGVGRILGVREDLLPADAAEARELTTRIYRRQVEGSDEGRALMAALLEAYEALVPLGSLTGSCRSLVHRFLDDEPITGRNISRALGLDAESLAAQLTRAMAERAGLDLASMARAVGLTTTDAMLRMTRGNSRAPFHVPQDLSERWWARSQGEEAWPAEAAHDVAALGNRITGILERTGKGLVTSAIVDAMPRWRTVGHSRDALFASWSLPPEAIRALVPPELEIDLFQGQGWVTLAARRMEDVRWQQVPGITGAHTELSLRTYVRRGNRRGIYFLSLDVDSAWLAVGGSAFLDLPAAVARMTLERQGDRLQFESERTALGAPPARLAFSGRIVGEPADLVPGTLEAFVVDPPAMFLVMGHRVMRGDFGHGSWKVARVEAVLSGSFVAAATGLVLPDRAPYVVYSPGSDTVVLPLEEDV